MSEPVHSSTGLLIREATQPLAPDDERYDWAHAILCEALSQEFYQVAQLVDPPDPYPPWAPLFNVETCPDWALPWLAQLVGVIIPPHCSPDQLRILIDSVAGFKVGTPASLKAAVQQYLIGTKTVIFRERDEGNPYALEILTLTDETIYPAASQIETALN